MKYNLISEKKFITDNSLEDIYARAKEIDPDIWEHLKEIRQHYEALSENYEAIVEKEVLKILGTKDIKGIHSVKYRIKDVKSLLIKIVKKKATLSKEPQDDFEMEKYRNLDASNYFKILTDLGGIRIIIRYREQWEVVHNWLWNRYFCGNDKYVVDYINDYKANVGKSFISEIPKAYYRDEQDKMFYEEIGRTIFDFQKSDEGYNSIHYIVNIDGKYVEIQMRTIYDEAWSECTHDLVYKGIGKKQKAELQYLAKCLAQQTMAAESISNFLYEKVNKKGIIYKTSSKGKTLKASNEKEGALKRAEDVKLRMEKLKEMAQNQEIIEEDSRRESDE